LKEQVNRQNARQSSGWYHSPLLSLQTQPDAAMQQANAIATGIGQLAVQQQQQYEEVKQEKELAKAQTVEDWLGPGRLAVSLACQTKLHW
jgi:hypothetical protein